MALDVAAIVFFCVEKIVAGVRYCAVLLLSCVLGADGNSILTTPWWTEHAQSKKTDKRTGCSASSGTAKATQRDQGMKARSRTCKATKQQRLQYTTMPHLQKLS